MTITVLFLQATGGDPTITISAQQARTLLDSLVIVAGVSWRDDFKVVQRAAGANFSVDVGAGHGHVVGTSVADQGKYSVQSDTIANVAITAGGSTTARYDLVYFQVRDKQADGGSAYDGVIAALTGTVGAGVPAVPANAIPLAEIGPIVTSTASITTSLIKDRRVRARAVDDPSYVNQFSQVSSVFATSTTRVNVIAQQTFRLTAAQRLRFDLESSRLSGVTGGELGRVILNVDGTEVRDFQFKVVSTAATGEVSGSAFYTTNSLSAPGDHTVKVDCLLVSGGSRVDVDGTILLITNLRE